MDLNRSPNFSTFEFPCSLEIKIVCRRKVDCRDVLVRKYGEEQYHAILSNPEPMVVPTVTRFIVVVFVLYN